MEVSDLQPVLEQFSRISLGETDSMKLFNRIDVKYAFNRSRLGAILTELLPHYQLLTVGDNLSGSYETHYFDTANLEMYLHHHNKKLNRYKVRLRKYLTTGEVFFEVKFKSNKERTQKERILLSESELAVNSEAADFLVLKTPYTAAALTGSLQVVYDRITLVNRQTRERLTFDTGLSYQYNGSSVSFPMLVIAELKRAGGMQSEFVPLMHQHSVHRVSLSKYCLGIASTHTGVKINNFKSKLLYVNKICTNQVQ